MARAPKTTAPQTTAQRLDSIVKSARNIPGVVTTVAPILSPYMILTSGKMIVDKAALAKLGGEWERITLREARAKIRAEKDRRKYDAAFSGYGASEILPASEIYKQRMY